MDYEFFIPGRLPGLNEIISACRNNRFGAAKQKREAEARIFLSLRKIPKLEPPVFIHFTWCEPDRRRDKDNIGAGKKFILDALVKSGRLPNDGWNQIEGYSDSFIVSDNPGVRVTIHEP